MEMVEFTSLRTCQWREDSEIPEYNPDRQERSVLPMGCKSLKQHPPLILLSRHP